MLRLLEDCLFELRHPRALHSQLDFHAQTPRLHQLHGFLEERRIGVQAPQVVIFGTLEEELECILGGVDVDLDIVGQVVLDVDPQLLEHFFWYALDHEVVQHVKHLELGKLGKPDSLEGEALNNDPKEGDLAGFDVEGKPLAPDPEALEAVTKEGATGLLELNDLVVAANAFVVVNEEEFASVFVLRVAAVGGYFFQADEKFIFDFQKPGVIGGFDEVVGELG